MISILPNDTTSIAVGSLLGVDMHIDLLNSSSGFFATNDVTEGLKISGYNAIIGAALDNESANQTITEAALPIRTVRLYHLEDETEELQENELVCFGKNYVLIQASSAILSRDLEDGIADLKQRGYTPILVKAEQYECLQDNYRNIQRVILQGCLFETDMLSLTGHNGAESKRLAQKLFKEERVSFAGSGACSADEQYMVNELFHSKKLVKQLQSPQIKNKELLTTY